MRRIPLLVAIAALGSGLMNVAASANPLERLVMPGKLVEAHADIESDCSACHGRAKGLPQSALCLDCHTDVADDIDASNGFHGRFDPARKNDCVACHTDHEGRDADIVGLDAGLFDHSFTDFALRGAHALAPCASCHTPGKSFSEAPGDCHGCHADDDVHAGGLGNACGDCHNASAWNRVAFDHATTGFRLTGGHATVGCQDCHRDNDFEAARPSCVSCHAVDDVHDGAKGSACAQCHVTSSWKTLSFDHAAETGFPLMAGHGGLACQACHSSPDFKDDAEPACVSCHASDDHHQGRNGNQCDRCHTPAGWRDADFDHDETAFALTGAHVGLECSQCHKRTGEAAAPTTCEGCHAVDDVHAGQLGACEGCHATASWRGKIRFDHDLSSFPLIGMHASTACGACHQSPRYHDTGSACFDCHAEADIHDGSLGTDCQNCHTPNDWAIWDFDHAATSFPLLGAHAELGCGACHADGGALHNGYSTDCGSCHRNDDPHDGQFGRDCGRCHTSRDFAELSR